MTKAIEQALTGRITANNTELATANLARFIARLPEWAQASMLKKDFNFENVSLKMHGLSITHGEYNPHTAVFRSNFEKTDEAKYPAKHTSLGVMYHEAAHRVDFERETIGSSLSVETYRNNIARLRHDKTTRFTASEEEIFHHASQPHYIKQYDFLKNSASKDIAPIFEIQAETGRHYFTSFAQHHGDEAKVAAEMEALLPHLWPEFRDHLIPAYKEKNAGLLEDLKKQGIIQPLSENPDLALPESAKTMPWSEKIGSTGRRNIMIGAGIGVAALAGGAAWAYLHSKNKDKSQEILPTR